MRPDRLLFALAGFFLLWAGCRELTDEKYISEGVIEYDITYPQQDDNSLFTGLFPEKMIMTFKDGKTSYEMTGGMGLFKTTIVSLPEENQIIHMVKVMNKKIAIIYDSNSIKQLAKEFDVKNIHPDTAIRNFAGYHSMGALVQMNHASIPDFPVFYTNDINHDQPNWGTPYNTIDGVLMKYRLKQYNIDMEFTATSVIKENIPDSIFKLPEDYKLVPKEEIDEIFVNFN